MCVCVCVCVCVCGCMCESARLCVGFFVIRFIGSLSSSFLGFLVSQLASFHSVLDFVFLLVSTPSLDRFFILLAISPPRLHRLIVRCLSVCVCVCVCVCVWVGVGGCACAKV